MEYKDSGIPWLGPIPAHWEVARGKTVLTLLDRPVREKDPIVTCFRDGTVTIRANKANRRINLSATETGYQGVEPGDLVVHSMDGFAGAIGISDARGKATPALLVLDSPHNKRYLMYYLRMVAEQGDFQALSAGVRNHSCDLTWNKLAAFPILLPSRDEQDRIAAVLDRTLERIDRLIAEAKACIEDYRAWKAARIYEVIAKGLDVGAEMIDSGVDWIGQIPATWTVRKLRTLVTEPLHQGTTDSSVDFDPALVRYIRIADIAADGTLEGGKKRSLPKPVSQENLLEAGDILFVRSGETVGRACLYAGSEEKAAWASYLIRARIDPQVILPQLVWFATLAANYEHWKASVMTNAVVKNISAGKYGNLPIVVPPPEEQGRLVEYAEQQILPIDDVIAQREALAMDLQSYRQSVLYAIVMGHSATPFMSGT